MLAEEEGARSQPAADVLSLLLEEKGMKSGGCVLLWHFVLFWEPVCVFKPVGVAFAL
jgi:hypothetical protein